MNLSKNKEKKFNLEKFLNKNKLSLVLGLIGVFLIGIGLLSATILSSKQEETSIEIIPSQEESQLKEIYVHVSGAVQKPGLYKLSAGSRVNDALLSAEGLSAQANRVWFEQNVNLAQKLEDGIKLYIPYQDETLNQSGQSSGQVSGEQTSIFVSSEGKININTSSQAELETLPKIGPVTAQKIIDSRPYNNIEDILKVSGIGDKTFEQIKDKICVY